jgi:predicted metal-dependent hydrolase
MDFTYHHRPSARARHLRISIKANGEVVVSSPLRFSHRAIEDFVASHRDWIIKTLTKIKITAKPWAVTNDQVTLFGQAYQLTLTSEASHPVGFRVDGKSLIFNSLKPVTDRILNSTEFKNQLERFLKNTAEKYIVPRTHQLAKYMKTSFGTLTLRQQSSRWGSCSSQGNLNFNWRLVHFPPEVIDYVIIHELAHRTHMNHSQRFWHLVAQFDPAYPQHKGWLKRYGLNLS